MVGFPLLLIPLAIYNCVAFLMPTVSFTEPLFKLTLMSGAEWPVTLSDVLLALGMRAVAARGHQGRAPRRKIPHRPSAVVHRVRRCRGRIFAVAEIRHLDLPAADAAFAGRFPVRHFAAQAAPCGCCVRRCARQPRREERRRRTAIRTRAGPCTAPAAAPSPARRLHRWPNPYCSIIPSRALPAAPARTRRAAASRRPPLLRPRWLRRASSRPMTRTRRRTSRALIDVLNDLPGPPRHAAAFAEVRAVGGLRVRAGPPPHVAGLRRLFGGRDQLRDKARVGPRSAAFSAGIARGRPAAPAQPRRAERRSRPPRR